MTLFEKWRLWDAQNPHFYGLFEKFSVELAVKGHRHMSTSMIFERIRWETKITTTGSKTGETYKVPNSYRALFGRKFMKLHPEYGQFFKVQKLTAVTDAELAQL